MPVDWDQKYKAEYDYAKAALSHLASFDEDWQKLVKRLQTLMGASGPAASEADALTLLRRKVLEGDKTALGHKSIGMDQGILQAVKAWSKTNAPSVAEEPKMRAAALKLLCHLYMIKRSGNRIVWVQSVPKTFQAWPSDDLHARGSTTEAVRVLLRSHDEHFTHEDRKHLSSASTHGLAWCQKTLMILAGATAAGAAKEPTKSDAAARRLVKRWFADPGTTEADLDKFIATLTAGFKKIVAKFNRGKLILTDWVPLRTQADAEEQDWIASEAFTFRSEFEGLDVVYIESNFFKHNAGNVLRGGKNWIRILVHEMTHLAAGTEDVNMGNDRYAWYGIGPHAGFPGSAAVRNADSWAFFCADCAGVLTDGERGTALKII